MANLETGQVSAVTNRYLAMTCVRLYVETDSAGKATRRVDGMIDGELRFINVTHEDDSNAATLSVYLEDDLENSLLAGESVAGLAAGSGGVAAKHKKRQFEDIGSIQARQLLVAGPQRFRFVRGASVFTRLIVEFWFVPAGRA